MTNLLQSVKLWDLGMTVIPFMMGDDTEALLVATWGPGRRQGPLPFMRQILCIRKNMNPLFDGQACEYVDWYIGYDSLFGVYLKRILKHDMKLRGFRKWWAKYKFWKEVRKLPHIEANHGLVRPLVLRFKNSRYNTWEWWANPREEVLLCDPRHPFHKENPAPMLEQ